VAIVCVHGPLRRLAGGRAEISSEGETIRALLRAVEADHPEMAGWVLDERGLIRRHIHVYVNGERAEEDSSVDRRDRVEVLPAISGG
jgi:molybdopterin synthase sulfur carrier subunit